MTSTQAQQLRTKIAALREDIAELRRDIDRHAENVRQLTAEVDPPQPELELPDGWTWDVSWCCGEWSVSVLDHKGRHRAYATDPDKATAIRAAQAAVDVLAAEKGGAA